MQKLFFLSRAALRTRFAVSLVSVIVLLSATVGWAEVIWRGDFETGTTEQWKGGAPKSDSVKIVQDPVREGKYAVRIDGTNAARRGKWDRIEFQHQPDPPGTAEGTERYFGWSVYLPAKFSNDMHAVGYFETRKSWHQLMSFEVRGEDILYTTRVPYAVRWKGKGKLTAGHWHDFAVHVLWSRDPAKGFVEVWFDGEKVVPRAMTATLLDENVAFFQVGLFRETSEVPETIIIDHVIEATTLEDVTPPPAPAKAKAAAGVEGLRLTVNAAKASFSKGDAVQLRVAFTNMQAKPILLYDPRLGPQWIVSCHSADGRSFIAVTGNEAGMTPSEIELMPGAAPEDVLQMSIAHWDEPTGNLAEVLTALPAGKYTLQATFVPLPPPGTGKTAYWTGHVTSGPVKFEISDTPPATQPAGQKQP